MKKGDVSGDIALNRLGAGEIFGEMSLFTGEKRNATVIALSKTTAIEIKTDLAHIINNMPG